MKIKNTNITTFFICIDFVILNCGFLLSGLLFYKESFAEYTSWNQVLIINIAFLATFFILSNHNSYQNNNFIDRSFTIFKRSFLFAIISILLFSLFYKLVLLFQYRFLVFWILIVVLRFFTYYLLHHTVDNYRKKGLLLKKAAIIGTDQTSIKFGSILKNNYAYGYNFLGHISYVDKVNTIGNIKDLEQLINSHGIQELFIAFSIFKPQPFLKELLKTAIHNGVRVKFLSVKESIFDFKKDYSLSGISIINPFELPLDKRASRLLKRFFDIVFSLCIIVFVLSWLFPVLGILIKLESSGPILFVQERAGLSNQTFRCFKFRSMGVNNNSNSTQARTGDPRITTIGKIMRKYNLDEFPQFINVFFGNMSVIGPRPHMMSHDAFYSKRIKYYKSRHFVKPGISGWAQVNGLRGETDELWKMEKRVEYDFFYLKNQSFIFDLKIIFLTFFSTKSYKNAG
jgi:putative colanic acid biosynthesis UDP-glucose lipid carrier transferase